MLEPLFAVFGGRSISRAAFAEKKVDHVIVDRQSGKRGVVTREVRLSFL